MSFDVIVNPIAGSGLAAKIWRKLEKELILRKAEYTVHFTEYAGHATELAKQLADSGSKTILSVGGDGTSYEIACGLRGSDVSLGIIPAGTGNDFVKALSIPKKPLEALDFFLSKSPRRTDCVTLNGELFLNACGTGFDISVLDYALKAKKFVRGMLPYLYGVIMTIFHFSSVSLKVTSDDGSFEGDALVVAISNGPFYGGGLKISPEAKADDGLLDVVIMRPVATKRRMFSYLPGLVGGKILTFPETSSFKTKSVTVESKGMRFNIDGEIKSLDKAVIEIIPGGINVNC